MTHWTTARLRRSTGAFVLLTLFAGCSGGEGPLPATDMASAADVPVDASRNIDAGFDSAHDDVSPPFEFGFNAVAFEQVQVGALPVTVTWNGLEGSGKLFVVRQVGGTAMMSFTAGTETLSFQGIANLGFEGDCLFLFGAGRCVNEAGADCSTSDALDSGSNLVFSVPARHNGEVIVLGDWKLTPGFTGDVQAPIDGRITPNNGFKPSAVPGVEGRWVGTVAVDRIGDQLRGRQDCEFEVVDGALVSWACDGAQLDVDDDSATPGPVAASLVANDVEAVFQFDDDLRLSFVAGMSEDEMTGVVVEGTETALTAPNSIDRSRVRGMFFFARQP